MFASLSAASYLYLYCIGGFWFYQLFIIAMSKIHKYIIFYMSLLTCPFKEYFKYIYEYDI